MVSKEIIEVFDYLAEKIGVSVDWTQTNVLPMIEELCEKFIKWEISTSIVWLILGIIFLISGIICLKTAIKHWKYAFTDVEFDGDIDISINIVIICGIACAVLLIFGIFISMTQIFDIVECLTFPEKTIYEFIMQKVNTQS